MPGKDQEPQRLTRRDRRAQQRIARTEQARKGTDGQLLTTRRAVIGAGIVGGIGLATGILYELFGKSPADIEATRYQVEQIGERMKSWILPDGESMSTVIPELPRIADVFSASSLNGYIPSDHDPLRITYSNSISGNFHYTPTFDSGSSVKVIAQSKNIKPFNLPYVSSVISDVTIARAFRDAHKELVIAGKEVSQIADFVNYCKAYKQLLEQNGASFTSSNPNGIPMTEDQEAVIIAMGEVQIEFDKGIRPPWFQAFADNGSLLRVGGILYANWKINYPEEASNNPFDFMETGDTVQQFLEREGLLRRVGAHFEWVQGHAPEINAASFLPLVNRYMQQKS